MTCSVVDIEMEMTTTTTDFAAALRKQCLKEFENNSVFALPPIMASYYDAIDVVGKELISQEKWWVELKSQTAVWTHINETHRHMLPMHFVVGRLSPYYTEHVRSKDATKAVWAVFMSPYTSNGGEGVGSGQGGAISSLFDYATGHLASAYIKAPAPTAYLNVNMKRPLRKIPGVCVCTCRNGA